MVRETEGRAAFNWTGSLSRLTARRPRRGGHSGPRSLAPGGLWRAGWWTGRWHGWECTAGCLGRLMLIHAALIVGIGSALAEPAMAVVLGAIGWPTVAGFSRGAYAELGPGPGWPG